MAQAKAFRTVVGASQHDLEAAHTLLCGFTSDQVQTKSSEVRRTVRNVAMAGTAEEAPVYCETPEAVETHDFLKFSPDQPSMHMPRNDAGHPTALPFEALSPKFMQHNARTTSLQTHPIPARDSARKAFSEDRANKPGPSSHQPPLHRSRNAAKMLQASQTLHLALRMGWKPLCKVHCNGLTGDFLGGHDRDLYIRCTGKEFASLPPIDHSQGGCIMSCSQFEKVAGRELSKKWKESIHVAGEGEGSKATLVAWLKRRADADFGFDVVGKSVWVCWCADADYYKGTIISYIRESGKHKVRYNDRFVEDLHLPVELLDFGEHKPEVPPLCPEDMQPLSPPAFSVVSPPPHFGDSEMHDLDRTFLHHYKPAHPLLHQGSGISVTSIFEDVEKELKELKRDRAAARVASKLAMHTQSEHCGERGDGGTNATWEETRLRGGKPFAEVVSGGRSRSRGGNHLAGVIWGDGAGAGGVHHEEGWGGNGAPLQRLPPNKRRLRTIDAESTEVTDHVSDNSDDALMQPPPKKLRSALSEERQALRRAVSLGRQTLDDVLKPSQAAVEPSRRTCSVQQEPSLDNISFGQRRGTVSACMPSPALVGPPPGGHSETDPRTISRWMDAIALQLDDVLNESASSPRAAADGDRGSDGLPLSISGRFQTMLVFARRSDTLLGFYDAMLSRFEFFQSQPDRLRTKMAEFIVAAVHEHDLNVEREARAARGKSVSLAGEETFSEHGN